mmetsp:Transcript_11024/g.12496  ORF Transcript_11024/g.12496 Transcript_11024/m.12496 type:complete len:82 (+) Transcript_11024:1-246(+)
MTSNENETFNGDFIYNSNENNHEEAFLPVNGTQSNTYQSIGLMPEPQPASPVVDYGPPQNVGMIAPKSTPAMFRKVFHPVY